MGITLGHNFWAIRFIKPAQALPDNPNRAKVALLQKSVTRVWGCHASDRGLHLQTQHRLTHRYRRHGLLLPMSATKHYLVGAQLLGDAEYKTSSIVAGQSQSRKSCAPTKNRYACRGCHSSDRGLHLQTQHRL